jgi:hypothetical protein
MKMDTRFYNLVQKDEFKTTVPKIKKSVDEEVNDLIKVEQTKPETKKQENKPSNYVSKMTTKIKGVVEAVAISTDELSLKNPGDIR